jgi:hypothetical protein
MSEAKKTKVAQKGDRAAGVVNVASPGRVGRALKAGPAGSQIHADGSSQASPNQHNRVNPSEPAQDLTKFLGQGETYRVGEHASSKEEKAGGFDPREPKPAKGSPVHIDLDSSYENPKGPMTTKVKK